MAAPFVVPIGASTLTARRAGPGASGTTGAVAGTITGVEWTDADEARAAGEQVRRTVPHDAHGTFVPATDRPTMVEFVRARDEGRDPALLPLAHHRIAVDAFAFFRGSAGLMAMDLADDPVTGLRAQICGDAHASNFGLYGTDDGRIVMNVNDFDETVVGPWEWDLKRLATSLVLAGRTGSRVGDEATRKAARHAARAYRRACRHLAGLPFLDAWTALGDESYIALADADALFDDFEAAAAKAVRNTSEKVAGKVTRRDDDVWRFVPDPPILTEVDDATTAAVVEGLRAYPPSLHASRRRLIERYATRDVAMRVVGTGSVGMRAYVALLQGNGDEALVLQLKQAGPSALAPYLPPSEPMHDGQRVVEGARLVQSATDLLFGWTTIAGRPFIVRQFRNRKGSIDPTVLTADHLDDYARLAGALLARAHCRTIDARTLSGYLAKGKEFDAAVARFALAYADRVELDHAEFVAAIEADEVEARGEQ
ncbi:DUF2252 domain-containing protein [Jatrophihabitans fulvus]